MRRIIISALALPFLLSAQACGEDVPSNPTWTGEVEQIIIGNCGRCHGPVRPEDPGNVPSDLRLDLFESNDPNIRTISSPGVTDRIISRAVDYESSGETQMPPDSYLTEDQKEILRLWAEQGGQL